MAKSHGLSGTLTHARWKSMLQRCSVGSTYSRKGISVCERWRDYQSFLTDMGECPSEVMTLDRLNNAKGYEPGNCRWATRIVQSNNKTNNRLLTWRGQTKTLAAWSRETAIPVGTICNRLRFGWDIEAVMTRAPHERGQMLTLHGKTLHLAEWARQAGLRYDCLSRRLRAGWDLERALTRPSKRAAKPST